MRRVLLCLATAFALLTSAAPAWAQLEAGVGRADITPPTGYYMMGWVRSDAKTVGENTRLFARAIVLKQGGQKVALVSEDLNGIAGGVLENALTLLKGRGFTDANVIDSASHTHAAPSGYYPFTTYDTVFMTVKSPTDFDLTGTLDPTLYSFEARQLATAIARADDNARPARLGWGHTTLLGLTANRSLEAHLADFGIDEPPGRGLVTQDPLGYTDTIDPNVDVLRIDQRHGKHWMPVGMWSNFADHGTVNKPDYIVYNADHHGSATRVVEATIRKRFHVPRSQDVVDVYGNSDEGDQSAGLTRSGPAEADYVGRVEAGKFLEAWKAAGTAMTTNPDIGERWTRICFCGQETSGGAVDSRPIFGLGEFTGSEEGRGPLYDITGVSLEGDHLPTDAGPQGDKEPVTEAVPTDAPKAVPLTVMRIADHLIASIPGEMTVGMGGRVEHAVQDAASGTPITRVVLSGLANEYLSYFTTPQEYEAQHYEGAATLYGEYASDALMDGLAGLSGDLARGQPAPTPYAYDPTNGQPYGNPDFPTGATAAKATAQPVAVARMQRAQFSWSGGPKGEDRPLGKAFVTVQRKQGKGWRPVADDLGVQLEWRVDASNVYTVKWQVPISARTGAYRFVVTANHYSLTSSPFTVHSSTALTVTGARDALGRVVVRLGYPPLVVNQDLTYRPPYATGGTVRFTAGKKHLRVRHVHGQSFAVPAAAGTPVSIAAGAARDRYGNRNAAPLTVG